MNDEIIHITNSLTNASVNDVKEKLLPLINDLINHDFNNLLQILYRIDVDEKKLKAALNANPQVDAASIVADKIIERQLEKIATKKKFSDRQKNNDENEW